MPIDNIHKSCEQYLTWHRSALPANPTSSRPRSWSLGNATLVVAERRGWKWVPQNRDLRLREHTPTENGHVGGPEVSCHQTYSARDWLSILRTPYPTQNFQRNHRTDGTGFNTCKECHKTESLWNHTTTDRKNVGANSYNFGDGTDQRVQSLMFMMMINFLHSVLLTRWPLRRVRKFWNVTKTCRFNLKARACAKFVFNLCSMTVRYKHLEFKFGILYGQITNLCCLFVKLNVGLPWLKLRSTRRRLFLLAHWTWNWGRS